MPIYRSHINELLRLGSQGTGGESESIVKSSLLNAYRRILTETQQDQRHREFSLTTVADTAQYGMPVYVKTIINIEDATDRLPLREMTAREFDHNYPGRTESNSPRGYYPFGTKGVQKQPASAGTLTVTSSAAGDDGNRYVTFHFYDSNGVLTREKVTLSGTSDVTTTGSVAPSEGGVERIVKSVDTGYSITGNLTVSDDDGNVIARIPPSITSPTYRWIEFDWIPSAARTYTVRSMSLKPDLVNDEDWPEFDEDYHRLLTYLAAPECLPLFGKQALADRLGGLGERGLKEFKDMLDPRPNTGPLTFSNVQNNIGQIPHGQPIRGIHFGLGVAT